jgi:hypothetical protein
VEGRTLLEFIEYRSPYLASAGMCMAKIGRGYALHNWRWS